MSGSFGANLSQFLDLSSVANKPSSLSEGNLVSITVNNSSTEQSSITISTPTTSKITTINQSLPESSVLLARVESSESGMRLRLLQAQNELKRIKTEELMKLLRSSGLDLSGRDASALKDELVSRGHLSTAQATTGSGEAAAGETSSGPSPHPLTGTNLPIQNAPDNLGLPASTNRAVNVTVVSSQEETATLQYQGRTFTVTTPESIDPGTQLKVTVQKTPEGRALQIEAGQNRSLNQQTLDRILNSLNLEANDTNRSRLSRTVLKHTSASTREILKQVKSEFTLDSVPDRSSTLESIKKLMTNFRSGDSASARGARDLSQLSREGLNQLLKEFGIEPDHSARKTLKTVLETDPRPSKTVAKTVMENIGLARNQDGAIDQNRLKSLLFLVKNDLPVKKELVDLLQFAAPDSDSNPGEDINALKRTLQGMKTGTGSESGSSLEQTLSNVSVPELNPGGSTGTSDDILRVLKQLGFDLERQVTKQPARASDSLRAQLTNLQQTLSEVATEQIQNFVESGNTDLQNESRRVLSQLFKFSMSSVAEDNSIYLFVPFPDGDETGLMRMRFQDESEGESIDDEQWSVTINLELSQLGSLRVGAKRHKQKLNLDFRARDKSTLSLLRDRSGELTDVLSERGFDVSVRSGVLRDDESLIDWNLYFDTDHYTGTVDVTV